MKKRLSTTALMLILLCASFSSATDTRNGVTDLREIIGEVSLVPADTGFDNDVWAITVYNGDLIIGGYFNNADGFSSIKVAGWDGSNWYSMSGFPNGNPIYWLHAHDGLLYAGQALTQLCSWDGSSWTGHEPWLGNTFGNIWALETYGNELYVGGGFNGNPDQPSYIAIWNGNGWDTVGTGIVGSVLSLDTYAGDLIAGGYFSTGSGSAGDHIAKWDGSSWSPLGDGTDGGVRTLTTFNSNLVAGGVFSMAGGVGVSNIAQWDGLNWSAVGGGLDGTVEALIVHDNKLIVGGRFLNAGGSPAARIASWDGASWSPIGGGFDDDVYALGVYNGYLIAGGAFSEAGGYVALWDGSVWRPVSDIVTAVEEIDTGELPRDFSLYQNYPNPFNPSTSISYSLPERSRVKIEVMNLLGQKVNTLVDRVQSPGKYRVDWDSTNEKGESVANGVYLYRITAGAFTDTKKMLLLK